MKKFILALVFVTIIGLICGCAKPAPEPQEAAPDIQQEFEVAPVTGGFELEDDFTGQFSQIVSINENAKALIVVNLVYKDNDGRLTKEKNTGANVKKDSHGISGGLTSVDWNAEVDFENVVIDNNNTRAIIPLSYKVSFGAGLVSYSATIIAEFSQPN